MPPDLSSCTRFYLKHCPLDVWPLIFLLFSAMVAAVILQIGRIGRSPKGVLRRSILRGLGTCAALLVFSWYVGFRHFGPLGEALEECRSNNPTQHAAACN